MLTVLFWFQNNKLVSHSNTSEATLGEYIFIIFSVIYIYSSYYHIFDSYVYIIAI